ncbi:MAG: hypothetical protein QM605_03890 [Sphingobium sp.]
MPGTDTIIAKLNEGYKNGALAGANNAATLLADPVVVNHIPPVPFDGPLSKDFMIKGWALEWGMITSGIKDYAFTPGLVKVDDNTVDVTLTSTGTVDGEPITLIGYMRLDIVNGEITTITGGFRDNGGELLQRLMTRPDMAEYMAGVGDLMKSLESSAG